jgi:hypothetical protein
MSNIKAQSSNEVQNVNGKICDLEARGRKELLRFKLLSFI